MPDHGPWRAPHLSLFLIASLWAAVVPLIWLAPGLVCDPVAWHRQELVLGVVGAAMGGYLLTALPNWVRQSGSESTGLASRPGTTKALVVAWVLGRLPGAPCLPDAWALAGQCLFPVALVVALIVPLVAARVWHRLPIALSPLFMVFIAARMRISGDSLTAVLGVALLVALVGGRIIPAFLRARSGAGNKIRAPLPKTARMADLVLGMATVAHLADFGEGWTGSLFLGAALLQAARMIDWPLRAGLRGGQVDLILLTIAWGWLPVGLGLVGAATSDLVDIPLQTSLHGLTMGLMGSMVLAVMARAWMRRQPGALRPGPVLGTAFALVQLAAVLRLSLAIPGLSALFWSAGWTLSAIAATMALYRPLPRPILSARR